MIPVAPGAGTAAAAAADGHIDMLALDELPLLAQRSVAVGFQRVLLCHTPGGIRAVADLCPHALQPLLGSEINADVIHCAKHGAMFDLISGRPKNGVTQKSLRIYPVRVCNGRIEIALIDAAK